MNIYIFNKPIGDNELTDDDMDNTCAFALRVSGSGLPRSTYNNMRRFSTQAQPGHRTPHVLAH